MICLYHLTEWTPDTFLRPEALESVFYMYRISGDPLWQDQGWQMFESIVSLLKYMMNQELQLLDIVRVRCDK